MPSAEMEFFRPDEYLPLPTKDILSWIFDSPSYDQDKPVCGLCLGYRFDEIDILIPVTDLYQSPSPLRINLMQSGKDISPEAHCWLESKRV